MPVMLGTGPLSLLLDKNLMAYHQNHLLILVKIFYADMLTNNCPYGSIKLCLETLCAYSSLTFVRLLRFEGTSPIKLFLSKRLKPRKAIQYHRKKQYIPPQNVRENNIDTHTTSRD